MAKDSAIMQMLKGNYHMMGLNVDDTYKKTDLLLKLYRNVCWSMEECFDDLNSITYESCFGDTETLTYLLNFAPEKELDIFRSRAVSAMQTRVLIDLIDKAIIKLRDYPDNGRIYHSIIDLKYIGYFRFTEEEILEQLDLERSTYYRKKKEATMLLGYVLFGFIMPEYIKTEKVANLQDEIATELRPVCY